MSKAAKIGMAIVGSLVFILVSLSILVKVVVTPEKIRETLLPLAEQSLQRKVEIGAIDIGIFSGVTVSDLRVQDKLTQNDFITVEMAAFKYKLTALLTGDIVIDRVLLEKPYIEVVREPDGQFNFSDLLTEKSAASESKSKAGKSGPAATSVLDLLINDVSVKGGELLFVDRSQSSKTPYRYRFDQVNFEASRITLKKAFPIKLSGSLNGSQIDLSGRYDIRTRGGDFDLQLDSLDLVKFSPYFRRNLPGKLGSADLSLNLEFQLQPERIESKGIVQLGNLDLVLNDLPQAAFQNARLKVDYSLAFDLQRQQLALSTFEINFNDSVIGLEGDVALAGTEPELKLALLFDKLDLRPLFNNLPKGLTRDFQSYSLAGQIDGRIELSGKPSTGLKLLRKSELTLANVQATVVGKRAGVDGTIRYQNQIATAQNLLLKMADQQLRLDFKAEDLTEDVIRGQFTLSAEQLNLNNLLPEPEAEPKSVATTGSHPMVERQPSLAEEIGPFDLPLDLQGTLRVGQLIYRQLAFEHTQADLLLCDNHLKIDPLRAKLAGGEVSIKTDVNLGVKGLQYQGQMEVDQSNLMGLVAGLVPQTKQSVSGLLQWQNNFSGRGTIPDNLLRALQVKGAFQLRQGQISGSPLLEQMATFLGVSDLKVLSFDTLAGQYDLRNGLTSLSGKLDSSKTKLIPRGTVGVDGSLNLKLDTRLAPELLQKIGVKSDLQKVVSDKDGWGVLPLVVKGTLSRPKVGFDNAALQQQAADKLKQEASQRLLDKIGGDSEKQKPVKQLLEGTLNRLFGQ